MAEPRAGVRATAPEPPRHAARPGPADRARAWVTGRGPLVALIGVAVLYVVVQALVFTWSEYYVNRDEAIYLTQVVPGEVAHDMAPHRTRGMSLLTIPVAPWAHSMPMLRGWMTLLGAAGIVVAFRPWIRTIGWAAPAAALVFSGWWVNVFFGAQLYPNFFAALGAVATAGHFVAYLKEGRRGDLLAVGVLIAFTSIVRPLDAVLAALGIWVGMLVFRRRAFWPTTLALAAGGLAGFAPWLIEGFVRFDLLPWELVFAARESGASGTDVNNVAAYLSNTDGPFRCVGECRAEAAEGISMRIRERVILGGYLAAAVVGLAGSPRRVRTQAMYMAGLALVALLGYYFTCNCAVNLRYIEPAFGFLALLIGGGLITGWTLVGRLPTPLAYALRALAVVLLVGWGAYQMVLADRHEHEGFASRERAYVLSQILDERADGEPCAAASAVSDRQIQFYSDCIVVSLNQSDGTERVQYRIGGTTSVFDLGLLQDAGYRIFALGRPRHVPDSSPVWDWHVEDISDDEVLGEYRLFEAPPDTEFDSNYREGYRPEDAGPPGD